MPLELNWVIKYEGLNFNSGNYLFTTDTKQTPAASFILPACISIRVG